MKETYPIPTNGKKPPAPSIRARLGTTNSTKKRPEDCYLETQRDWEEAIFRHANHFTVFRLHRRVHGTMPERESTVYQTFPEAITVANPDPRLLVYAVTLSGDAFCVPRSEWIKYLDIWNER